MRTSRIAVQEDLFESSRFQELRRRVKELDLLIARALRKSDYVRAKELTDQQSKVIQELVALGEGEIERE